MSHTYRLNKKKKNSNGYQLFVFMFLNSHSNPNLFLRNMKITSQPNSKQTTLKRKN